MSCQCKNNECTYIGDPDKEINLRDLILYTPIPELWEMFETIISLSPLDANGYFTLSMSGEYLDGRELPTSRKELWNAMSIFLGRRNHALYLKRSTKNATGFKDYS